MAMGEGYDLTATAPTQLESPWTDDTAENLIDALQDTVDGFDAAIGSLGDAGLVETLRRLRADHEGMLAEATGLAAGHGITLDEADDGTLGGALHRSWMELAAALTVGDEAIIEAVESGHAETVRAFEQAIDADLPEDLAEFVRVYLPTVVEAHDEIEGLLP